MNTKPIIEKEKGADSTVRKYRTVQTEGTRQIERDLEFREHVRNWEFRGREVPGACNVALPFWPRLHFNLVPC